MYFEIRRIGLICRFLTTEATKILVISLGLSCLDYCNSLLAGIPQKLVNKVQYVMNCDARLVSRASKCKHIAPPSFGFALVACRKQKRKQDCCNFLQHDHLHCPSLPF